MTKMNQVTLSDEDIFPEPQYKKPSTFTPRTTVKAIVRNDKGQIGLVTNDTHKLFLLPGGGAEVADLEGEVRRECREELRCDMQHVAILGSAREFRYRDAQEYHTTCFVGDALDIADTEDSRTENEMLHNLHPVWLPVEEAHAVLEEQSRRAKNGDVPFYNTAFNAVRDALFFSAFLEQNRT
jgi:ADP-ribose pyrophosphatase YjhB (NUDIX family)